MIRSMGALVAAALLLVAGPLAANDAKLTRTALAPLERTLTNTILETTADDQADVLGSTRGTYLDGFGVVFTAEVSIVATPGLSPFRQEIKPEYVKRIHDRKMKRLPLLRQAVAEMAVKAAKALDSMPANQQVIVAVRLMYVPWEDTAGLPAELRVQADRATLLKKAGIDSLIHMEEH